MSQQQASKQAAKVEESLRVEERGEAALSLRLEDEEESEDVAEAPLESRGPW
jgi:hypothetical protein